MKSFNAYGNAPRSRAPESDRRISRRQKAFVDAWADAGGTAAPVACKVLDLSATGAKLAVPATAHLPTRFHLHLGGTVYAATIVWTHSNQIGVEFAPTK
jgi:hypothetical protein